MGFPKGHSYVTVSFFNARDGSLVTFLLVFFFERSVFLDILMAGLLSEIFLYKPLVCELVILECLNFPGPSIFLLVEVWRRHDFKLASPHEQRVVVVKNNIKMGRA